MRITDKSPANLYQPDIHDYWRPCQGGSTSTRTGLHGAIRNTGGEGEISPGGFLVITWVYGRSPPPGVQQSPILDNLIEVHLGFLRRVKIASDSRWFFGTGAIWCDSQRQPRRSSSPDVVNHKLNAGVGGRGEKCCFAGPHRLGVFAGCEMAPWAWANWDKYPKPSESPWGRSVVSE